MFVTASIIRFPESLYAPSNYLPTILICFYLNLLPKNEIGAVDRATKVSAQLELNAIDIPVINDEAFWTLNPIIVEVNPWIVLQSTDKRAVSVPALFSALSKKGIGILNNFLNVSYLNFTVKNSATTYKRTVSND